jgi:PAS domain S-box-containing protein
VVEFRDTIRSRLPLLVLLGLLTLYVSWISFDWLAGDVRKLQIVFLAPIDALVVYTSWQATRRCEEVSWARRFWLFVTLAWAAELSGDLILAVYDIGFDDPTFPSLADAVFLAFYPLMFVAIAQVPIALGTRSERLRSALDCATVVVGGGAVIWYFVLGPVVTEGGQPLLTTVVSTAYPVGDVVLLGAIANVLMRRNPRSVRGPLRLVAVGLLLLIVADTLYGAGQFEGTYKPGDLADAFYFFTAVPFVMAAVSQRSLRRGEPDTAGGSMEPGPRASRLPLLGMAVGFGVLLATQWDDKFFPDLSLLLFALVLAGLVATRQYVAQRELVQLQQRVRTIVEGVAEGIITFSEQGQIVWVNPAAEEIFGIPAQRMEGEPVDVLFADLDWREIGPLVMDREGYGKSVIGQRRKLAGRRADASSFPLELIVTEAQLDGERVLIGIGQDVTERERAQAALRESERRFRGIFESAGVGIAFSEFEEDGPRIVSVNTAFSAMLGYEAEELEGADFTLITHPDDMGDLAELGEAVRAGRDQISREQRCMRKDGAFIWGALTVSILRDEEDRPRFAIGMLQDVTARREAERVKDEFVAVVGHELRTPLTSIRGSLGLLAGGVLGDIPPEASRMLRTAVSNTDRLVRLINDILDIERIDAGRGDIQLAPVTSSDLVRQSVEVIQATAQEAGVGIEVEPMEDPTVAADADRIVQVLTNLLGNAIKFSEGDGTVAIGVDADHDRARFTVRDEGRGIPGDQLESIFERFSQVDASDARDKGGTGLGLAIARSIVERHGGEIWAESIEGEGSTFGFTLPMQATADRHLDGSRPGMA